jgi:transcriptional regulator with XRE-family HTH domain
MARWKPLPDTLDPQQRELVVRLRELKDQARISTASLARKTAYSRSSWDRYLNARLLPPRPAVEALGRLAGVEPARLLALWELAAHASQGRAPEPATDAGPARALTGPRAAWWRPTRIVAPVAAVVLVASVAVIVWLSAEGRTPWYRPSSTIRSTNYACDYTTREGHLYAGHSTTSDRLVALNGGSQDVVEVQCLLKRHGIDPGRVDGLFGKQTEQAVETLQSANGAVADGIVGPQTWALLRQ